MVRAVIHLLRERGIAAQHRVRDVNEPLSGEPAAGLRSCVPPGDRPVRIAAPRPLHLPHAGALLTPAVVPCAEHVIEDLRIERVCGFCRRLDAAKLELCRGHRSKFAEVGPKSQEKRAAWLRTSLAEGSLFGLERRLCTLHTEGWLAEGRGRERRLQAHANRVNNGCHVRAGRCPKGKDRFDARRVLFREERVRAGIELAQEVAQKRRNIRTPLQHARTGRFAGRRQRRQLFQAGPQQRERCPRACDEVPTRVHSAASP